VILIAFLRKIPDRRQRGLDTSYKQQIAASRLQAAEICFHFALEVFVCL
jgi:hypothetical protein